jgi:hypothetical protein
MAAGLVRNLAGLDRFCNELEYELRIAHCRPTFFVNLPVKL